MTLVVLGGALMWLAPQEALFGIMLLGAGIALELVGITLEHADSNPPRG